MSHARGPEEFFEVFREVQSTRKKRDDKPPGPGAAEAKPGERTAAPNADQPGPAFWEGELTLRYPVAALIGVAIVLLAVAAYLAGRQHGWARHSASQAPKAEPGQTARPGTAASAAVTSDEPELVDGKVFTLLISGAKAKDLESVKAEAEYLNRYGAFKALPVQAYVWRDREGRYRLCARGFLDLAPALREDVRREIRTLKSRFGKHEYNKADFFAP